MIDLILNEPQLLFSLALTAKTCLVTLALFLVAGPLAAVLPREGAGSSPARPRLRHHDSVRLSARGARLHALDGARAHEPRGRSA